MEKKNYYQVIKWSINSEKNQRKERFHPENDKSKYGSQWNTYTVSICATSHLIWVLFIIIIILDHTKEANDRERKKWDRIDFVQKCSNRLYSSYFLSWPASHRHCAFLTLYHFFFFFSRCTCYSRTIFHRKKKYDQIYDRIEFNRVTHCAIKHTHTHVAR